MQTKKADKSEPQNYCLNKKLAENVLQCTLLLSTILFHWIQIQRNYNILVLLNSRTSDPSPTINLYTHYNNTNWSHTVQYVCMSKNEIITTCIYTN